VTNSAFCAKSARAETVPPNTTEKQTGNASAVVLAYQRYDCSVGVFVDVMGRSLNTTQHTIGAILNRCIFTVDGVLDDFLDFDVSTRTK